MIKKTLKYIAGLLAILLVVIGITGFYPAKQVNPQFPSTFPLLREDIVRYWLQKPQQLLQQQPLSHLQTLNNIYTSIDNEALWVDEQNLTPAGKSLLQQLNETSADQLLDYQYHLPLIRHHLHKLHLGRSPKVAATVDILLTDAFISYAGDILNDRLLLEHIEQRQSDSLKVSLQSNHANDQTAVYRYIADQLSESHKLKQLNSMIGRLSPNHPEYIQLRLALQRHQDLTSYWQPIDEGPTIKPEEQHPQILQLRELLTMYGDYPLQETQTAPDSGSEASFYSRAQTFNSSLVDSLKQFQRRHGMTGHGILDPETRRRLNVPPQHRIRQLALNMKRWRELPDDLGDRYIWVNMTNYELKLISNGETELAMKVIIGRKDRMTPELQESVSTLVLNPHWNVPDSIAREDILPKVQKDPGYLTRNNMRVLENWTNPNEIDPTSIDWGSLNTDNFKFRFQQVSGPGNALGRIKFLLPNDRSIYMHDTNNTRLFNKKNRTFSSGCIRLEKPLKLAKALLLGHPSWGEKKLMATLNQGDIKYIKLQQELPTYIAYHTVWVDEHNLVHFRDDFYQHDAIINKPAPVFIQL